MNKAAIGIVEKLMEEAKTHQQFSSAIVDPRATTWFEAAAIIMEMVEALDKQGRALAAWVNILEARCITADDGEPIPTGGHTWGRNPTHAEVQAALEAQNDAATLLAKVRGKCPRPPHTGV